MRWFIALALAAALQAADATPRNRLSEVQDVQPTRYHAELTLDPSKTSFSGRISISLNVGKPLRTLWLNQNNLSISEAVIRVGAKESTAEVIASGEDFEGLRSPSDLPKGPATLTIIYTGTVIEKNTIAIFRENEDGNEYLFTQFESTDARGAFPCFDEPSYKTPWQLTLHIPAAEGAISNTPILSEQTVSGTKTVTFRETKPLPSYLVAFGVGPFEFVNAGVAGKNKVPVRIVVPKGHTAEAKYAAEVTATILTRLEDYFGIPFPYDKSDQVAIPQFGGAMENPGMVTYGQSILLADPKMDGLTRQRRFASIAGHELAHQWFGDLETTAWWDDIWLNEAFATWMSRKLLAEWKPEWQTRVSDVADAQAAESSDSLVSARKIRQEILSKDDIGNAFDDITYEKGATVIGMFENWLGAEDFRKGVRTYLTRYSFRAATAGDFLDALSSGGRNVTQAFSTFLNQSGVPLISVSLECANGAGSLHVEQKRFLPAGSKGSTDESWSVPLCIRYGSGVEGTSECSMLTQASQTIALKSCPAWVQANDRAVGYYRVQYPSGLLASLTNGDIERRLAAPERASLMGDVQALAVGGKVPAADALKLVEKLHNDSQHYVVSEAVRMALFPVSNLVPPALMPQYQRFIAANFSARAHELGWTPKSGESDDAKLLRPQLLSLVATWGADKELAAEAMTLAERWFNNHAVLDPDLARMVLGVYAFYGDRAAMERLLTAFTKTEDKQVRQSILAATGFFRDARAIELGMNALADGSVPFLEGARLLFNGLFDPATRLLPLHFLEANLDKITSRMPTEGDFNFGSLFPRVGSAFCDAQSRDELRKFMEPLVSKYMGAPRNLEQTLEGNDLCIANKAVQTPSVAEFLAKY